MGLGLHVYVGMLSRASERRVGDKRDTLSEAVVSLRTVVTFVTWLISRTEFSSTLLQPQSVGMETLTFSAMQGRKEAERHLHGRTH